jgi:PXPV repeat (3 copies)
MKRLILISTVLAVASMNTQTAKAGECEWATVGKVLTGVAVAAVVVSALDCQPSHASVTYTYSAPVCATPAPVVYRPAPVVYAPAPVVFAPRPVVVCGPPVYIAPARPVGRMYPAYRYGSSHGNRYARGHYYR